MTKSHLWFTLWLTAASASAQTLTTPADPQGEAAARAAALQQVTLTDVAATHWARAAVELLVKRGILTGYPDSTFRGEGPVTRYQLALILARVLDSGALSGTSLSKDDQVVVQRGVASVEPEMNVVHQQLALLSSTVSTHDEALKEQARVILELRQGRAEDKTRLDTLEARLVALQDQIAQMEAQRRAQAEAALNTSLPPAAETAVPVTPPSVAVEDPKVLPDARFITPPADTSTATGGSPSRVAATASAALFSGRLTPMVGVQYKFSPRFAAEGYVGLLRGDVPGYLGGINVQTMFGGRGDFTPYASVGAGLLSSESASGTAGTNTNDFFGRAAVGAEYRLSSTLGLTGELGGNYFLTSNGLAAQQGVNLGGRLGIKLSF